MTRDAPSPEAVSKLTDRRDTRAARESPLQGGDLQLAPALRNAPIPGVVVHPTHHQPRRARDRPHSCEKARCDELRRTAARPENIETFPDGTLTPKGQEFLDFLGRVHAAEEPDPIPGAHYEMVNGFRYQIVKRLDVDDAQPDPHGGPHA